MDHPADFDFPLAVSKWNLDDCISVDQLTDWVQCGFDLVRKDTNMMQWESRNISLSLLIIISHYIVTDSSSVKIQEIVSHSSQSPCEITGEPLKSYLQILGSQWCEITEVNCMTNPNQFESDSKWTCNPVCTEFPYWYYPAFKLAITVQKLDIIIWPGPVFCLLLGVSSGCARPIKGQVTSVTWPVIGWA